MSKLLKTVDANTEPNKYILEKLVGVKHFRSVFAGNGGIEFSMPYYEKSEIWNDISGNIVNFYEVLRNEASYKEFVKLCNLTPYSEEVFNQARQTFNVPISYFGNSVHRAWAFFVANQFSDINNHLDFATTSSEIKCGINENVYNWLARVDSLYQFHERLKYVELRNKFAGDFIKEFDNSDAIFYCNPPKLSNISKVRGIEWVDTLDFLEILTTIDGKFILATEAQPLYNDFAANYNWIKAEFTTYPEYIWTNF